MPTLAAVLIMAAIGSIRPHEILTIFRTGREAQIGMVSTFLATLFLPVAAAVGIGVALSLLLQLNREAMDLAVVQLVRQPDGHFIERPAPDRLGDGVTVLDVYGSLLYAGARTLQARLPNPAAANDSTTRRDSPAASAVPASAPPSSSWWANSRSRWPRKAGGCTSAASILGLRAGSGTADGSRSTARCGSSKRPIWSAPRRRRPSMSPRHGWSPTEGVTAGEDPTGMRTARRRLRRTAVRMTLGRTRLSASPGSSRRPSWTASVRGHCCANSAGAIQLHARGMSVPPEPYQARGRQVSFRNAVSPAPATAGSADKATTATYAGTSHAMPATTSWVATHGAVPPNKAEASP